MKKPAIVYLLQVLLFFLSANALAGGMLLIISPSGELMGMSKSFLYNSPFSNFLIPGLLLVIFVGIIPGIAFIEHSRKIPKLPLDKLNIYKNRQRSWTFSVYSGLIAIFWIATQQLLTEYFIIQPVILLLAFFILVICFSPNVLYFYEIRQANKVI